jgi:hypothetical protein
MAKSRIIDLIEGKEKAVVSSDYLMQGQRFYTPPGGEEVNTYDKGLGRSSIDLQQQLRNSNQTGTDMAASAAGRMLQVPFSVIGNVASALDFEDYVNQDQEVGNWLTTAMDNIKTDIRDANPIYRRSEKPLDIGDPAWWWDNGSSLVESATAFVATGYLTGAGLGMLGKGANSIKWLKQLDQSTKAVQGTQWLANSAALNQAESIGIATNVYDSVLREKLQSGLTENEAMQAAADAASTSINVNRINILLNLTSAKAFIRPPQMTRQLLEKTGAKQLMKTAFGHEGIQESAEEMVNMFAENKALAQAAGKKYGLTEAMGDMLSAQGLENAILGFAGGAGQTLLTGAAKALPINKVVGADGKTTYMSDNTIHNQKYEAQQKVIAQQNQIASVNGFKGLTDVFDSVDNQEQLLNNLAIMAESGNKEGFEKASNNLLIFQAQKAFESGTTENLLEVYDKLGSFTDEQYQAQGLEPEYAKKKAKEAVNFIEELESDYIDATMYKNPSQVFQTAANIQLYEKMLGDYNNQLSEKKSALYNRVNSKVTSGVYNTKSGTSEEVAEKGTNNKIVKEKLFTYNPDELLSNDNPYTGKAATAWNKFKAPIKNTKEYREAKALKDKADAISSFIEKLRDEYDTITSPEEQQKLEKQEQFVAKVQELDKKFPKKDKEYVKEFEDIATEAGIAKEMVQVATKTVKDNVKSQHVADKAELAEQPVTQPQSVNDLFGFDESDFMKGLKGDIAPTPEPVYETDLDKVFSEENEKAVKQVEEQKQKTIAEAINPDVTEEFTEKSILEEQPKDDNVNPYQDASRLMFLNIPYTQTADEIIDGTDKVDYKYNINPDNLLPGTKIYVQIAPHPDAASRVNDETRPYQTKYMEVRTVDGDVLIGGLTNETHYIINDKPALNFNAVKIYNNTKEEGNESLKQLWNVLSQLEVGQVIQGDNEITVVTDKSKDSITLNTFERNADGSLTQISNPRIITNIDGKVKGDYNPHSVGTNNNGERVVFSDSITNDIIDLSKETILVYDSKTDSEVESQAFKTFVPSKINNSGTVLYTNSSGKYSREVPVSPAQAQEQLEQLNNFRKQVFENGKVETTVEFKGYGAFNTNKGKKPQNTVAKYQPTATIAYVGAEGKLFDGLELHPLFKNGQVMNANKIASENHSGQTYSIVQLRGKEFVALPVWHKKLSETDMGNRIQDNIIRTVDKFISLEEGKRDVNVLINHVRQFINWRGDAGNKNKYTKVNYQFNVIAKDNAIIISRADGKTIVDKVPYIRISNDMKVQEQTKQLILNTLKEVLSESYTATSAKHLDNNKQVKLGDDTWSYKDFVKEITFTNVEGIEVEDGKYAYTVQPYINIDMKIDTVQQDTLVRVIAVEDMTAVKKYGNDAITGVPLKASAEFNELTENFGKVTKQDFEEFAEYSPAFDSQEDYDEYLESYKKRRADYLKANPKPVEVIKTETKVIDQPKVQSVLERFKRADTRLSPRTLTEAEVESQILQRDANDPDFVEGLTADKVNDVVYYLINRFAQALDSGEGEPNSILDEVQNNIQSDKETFEELVKEDSEYQKHLDSLNAVLNGWNKIATISQKRFGSLYKFTFDDEVENDEDVVEETWDKASFEKNDKLRVGTELKLFLSGILDIDSQGKKYNFIGQDKYIHWEVAYESLKNILTNAPHDYNKIVEILKAEVQNKPWVKGVVDKLATANDKILTQFVSRMPGHALNMVYVSFATNKKGTTLRTHRTNTSAAKDIVFNTWSNQMRKNLYNLDRGTGTYTFDKELADELIEEYKSWENPEPQAVRTWLEMVGITFNDVAWNNIVRNGYKHGRGKDNTVLWKDLFGKYKNFQQSSPSFLAQIANGLQRAKNIEITDDEINDLDNKDTPITDSVISKTMAYMEASTSNELRPNSFRDGDKQLYSYILEQKSIDRLNWLIDDAEKQLTGKEQDYSILKQLLSTAFAKDSSWLNLLQSDTEKGKHFREVFDINHLSITALKELGKRYGGDRKIVNLDDAEHELVKVGLFQDKSQGSSKYGRTARFFFPTLSDKSQMLMVSTLAEDFGTADSKYINGEGQITDEGYSYLYKLLVKPEVDRIHEFNKFGKNINISGYNQGADKFIMFSEMNNVQIEGKNVTDMLDTYGEETPQLVLDKIESVLTNQLKYAVTSIVQDKINEWEQLGLNELLDNKYLADMVGDKHQTAAQDFVVNYLISNAEAFKTFIGDPAQYWKSDFFGTDTNITKRLAAILAPGTKLANSDGAVYIQLFLDDTKIPSVAITELQELLGSEANVYTGIEGTDAQEFTTVLEEFYIAKNNGEITGDLFDVVSAIIITELQKGNHDYLQIVADAIDGTELQDEYNDFIFQPRKPVYTGDYYHAGDHPVMRDMYIKSSSFPLSPNMTKGKEIDKLRIAMEKLELQTMLFKDGSLDSGTVRASFKSANKVGAPAVSLPAMDKTGNFYDYDTETLKAHSLTLARRNFRIQQDVPFKGEKEEINRGTQESKVFFTNLLNVNGFKWNDKTVKGYELYKEYESRMTRIFEIQKQNLLDEIGVESFEEVSELLGPNNKNIERKKEVLNTIVEILRTEALDRNYPKKDILALQVTEDGELKQPLWLAASHFRYENLLSALVKQRVLKMGMPGASFVLGTEEGFKDKTVVSEEVPESNEIVYTDKWTGKLKPAIQNNGFAQVLMPSRFKDKNGNLVDIKKFAKQVNGKWMLDNDKVDQDLLKIFGFRIPTSGLMSMSGIEIVGFLPATMGDLIIAPRDFTKQMGSDFDIDKLYTYMKYHNVDETISADNSTEDKKLKNEIIDIHHSVMGNSSKVVKEQILKPLTTKHIEEQAALVDGLVTKRKYRTLLNDTWQKDKLIQLASGKIGTGTTSLDVTFHSIAQVADAAGSPLTLMTKAKTPLVITIDGKTSNGNLGGEKTLDDSDYISVANSEMQNASVDNATVQALGKLNINNYTFSAERMLRLLGFDKGNDGNNIRYMLLSQPIVKDFVQALQKQQSGLSDYDANFEQNIINILLKKYETTSNVSLKHKNNITDDFNKRTASITTSKLVDALTGYSKIVEYNPKFSAQVDGGEFVQPTEAEINRVFDEALKESEATYKARIESFNELQGAALDLFLIADYYGREIAKVEGLLNVDSKGFGKSIPEIIEAVSNAQKILEGGNISNVSELIGTIYADHSKEWSVIKDTELAKQFIAIDNLRIKPSNIPGAALTFGLGSAYNMWKNLFPYQQDAFEGVVRNIHVNSKIDAEASATKLAELKTQILSEFKKSLFSDVITAGLSTEDVTTNRKKLFIDTEDNQSLASYLDTIKPLMNNSFINRLDTHIVNTGLPSRISYNNAAGEDIDENLIYDAAFSLFASDAQLPEYNGEVMTVRKLLQYLTLYAYAGDPIQQATQFIKFIPYELLEATGTNQYARDIHNRVMSNDLDLYRGFEKQYFQHNPTKITQLPVNNLEKLTGIKGKDVVLANEFTATTSFVEEYGEVKYVAYYIQNLNTVNKKNRWKLFELGADGKYHSMPVLGVFGMNEYQLGQENVLSIVNGTLTNNQKGVSLQENQSMQNTPENIQSLKPNQIFVFGSNAEGVHGKGAALLAKQKFGAKQKQAEGLQGQSYAVITKKNWRIEKSSTLAEIELGLKRCWNLLLITQIKNCW